MFDNNRLGRLRAGVSSIQIVAWAAVVALLIIAGMPIAGMSGIAQAQDWSMSLEWTAPGDDGNIGTASAYDIRYSTDSITDANWALATPVTGVPQPSPSGSSDSCVISGLQALTLYYVAMKSRDEAFNWSGLSNVISKIALATGIGDDGGLVPEHFELSQNYPNPFNPGTTIECTLPSAGRISISVYNLMGQAVVRLVDEVASAGQHQYSWNGTDRWGNPVASGVYLYHMTAANFSQSRRMTLLR